MRYLLTALLGTLTLAFFYSCQKELSREYGSAAKGSLQSNTSGDCLPKTVAGAYIANKAINDSNYIDVTVNVTAAGPYKISTDTINGYWFSATGTFTNTGSNTVRLKGGGKPALDGPNDFTVSFDSSICDVEVTVLPAGSTGGPATYTFVSGTGGACGSFASTGNYIKDSTLDGRHTVTVQVNVTAIGTYNITTTAVNGYSFSGTGSFTSTGVKTVTLQGTGKPLAAGTNNFTVSGGGNSCTFSITVAGTAPGACTFSLQGTYTAGTATTAANKVVLTHSYTTAGSYNVTVSNVNGYSFGPLSYTATAGSNNITLNATGTPTAAGTNTFNVDYGDGTSCTFDVVVGGSTPPPTGDYFPMTLNSWWTYDDVAGSDTFKVTVKGPITIGGQTYQKFEYSDATGILGIAPYRKDASANYFQLFDTTDAGPTFIFNQATYEVLFLKNSLTAGASWNSDVNNVTYNGASGKTLRFEFSCVSVAPATFNGKTFSNVYKVKLQVKVGTVSSGFAPYGPPSYSYYAPGVGLIGVDDGTNVQQAIRFWQVF